MRASGWAEREGGARRRVRCCCCCVDVESGISKSEVVSIVKEGAMVVAVTGWSIDWVSAWLSVWCCNAGRKVGYRKNCELVWYESSMFGQQRSSN